MKSKVIMIKAKVIERYIKSVNGSPKSKIETIVHEERFFSSQEKFQAWFDLFKAKLWEDDKNKVKLIEGIYIETEEIELDNMEKPKKLKLYASFREGISYNYAS
jgi:hypothetical protein